MSSTKKAGLDHLLRRIAWELERFWHQLDTMSLMAASALALLLGLQLTVIAPLRATSAQLTQRLEALKNAPVTPPPESATLQGQEGELPSFFPPHSRRDRDLLAIHQLAGRLGIKVLRADYQSEPLADLPLQKLSAHLELRGSYIQQRSFLHELLRSFPHLSLDQIRVERNPELADSVNAVFELRLHYLTEAGPEQRN